MASPPVAKILDYGKYRYELAQRDKESRRKAQTVAIKEMKYRPKIGDGDFGTKTRKVGEFLAEGHKVKITIMFRGREIAHPELGKRILDRIAEVYLGSAKVEAMPKLDGKNMVMVLAPDKKLKLEAKDDRPEKPSAGNPKPLRPDQIDALEAKAAAAASAAESGESDSVESDVVESDVALDNAETETEEASASS
jgi:translation initiation factor IF-3